MQILRYLKGAVSRILRQRAVEAEIEEEMRSHIAHHADDLERDGLPRAEAERRARVKFGGREKYKEECREALPGHFFETTMRDARFALRGLRKAPGFASVAIVTLALGIGANTVVFSVVNALILRPLNVSRADDLYMVERSENGGQSQSYPDYLDLRDRNRSLDGLIAYTIARAGLDTGGNTSASWAYQASGNYFDVLGVQPYVGRFFHTNDEHGPNGSPYIVLSYAFWRARFGGDPSVPGRTALLNKHPYTILGVAPPDFRGTELFYVPDFWAPLANIQQVDGWNGLNQRASRRIWLIARVKTGVTQTQATADLNSIASYLATTYPKEDGKTRFSLAKPGLVGDLLRSPVRNFLVAVTALAGLVLLGACVNLGSLFAARTADRSREMAMRLALGSSGWRILRQLLTETVLVSLAGGAVGLAGGLALLRALSVWRPIPDFPVNVIVGPDAKVYGVAFALALASGIFCAALPMRQVLRADPYATIKSGATGVAQKRRFAVRDLLLGAQIAICAMMVTSSFVAVRGLVRSLRAPYGFSPQNAMVVDTDVDMAGHTGDRAAVVQRQILDAVQSIPGVQTAGISGFLPLGLGSDTDSIFRDDGTSIAPANSVADAQAFRITPGYFEAAGTRLVAGRTFEWTDDRKTPLVAIVNQEFARRVFGPETGAIGRYFRTFGGSRIQVVGIAEQGKYVTLTEAPRPAIFLPILQTATSSTWLIARSTREPGELGEAIREKLLQIDPGLPAHITTWNDELATALFSSRAATVSLGVLGALSAVLALTGIFGMAAYSVSKRTREFGIRVALGAQRKELLGAALGRAFRLLAAGSAVGVLLGVAATRLLALVVYQASPRDPVVLIGTAVTMLLLGLAATWIPARRALRVDPLILMREE